MGAFTVSMATETWLSCVFIICVDSGPITGNWNNLLVDEWEYNYNILLQPAVTL